MRLIEIEEMSRTDVNRIKRIKRDCQPFLQAVDNPIGLFRGVNFNAMKIADYPGKFKLMTTHLKNRKPRMMGQARHDVINEYFTEAFGEPFRNSVMVLGGAGAGSFGTIYNVFPIGDFTSLWSPKVGDLNWAKLEKYKIEEFPKVLESFEYVLNDLNTALVKHQKSEIMIRCKKYYIWGAEDFDRKSTRELLRQ